MNAPLRSDAKPDSVRVHPPEFLDRGEWIRVLYRVEGLGPGELWFDVDAEYRDFLSNSCDPALAALMAAAMASGKPLRLEGPTSARLLWHVRNTVTPVVTRQLPFLAPIQVTAAEARSEWEDGGSGILTGFSCGVDSFSAIQDHLLDESVPREERVTHLLFSHVGHHGYGPEVDERADQRWRRIKEGAEDLGLPILRVVSNTPEFYPPQYDSRLNWIAALTLRNSAVPLLLQMGVRRFLFASSHSWRDIGVFPSKDSTKADPILLPALGTERTELCAVGTEYTRVEKTRRIAEMGLAQKHLDVCIMEGGRNCSWCEKCLRTLLTLDLLGFLEKYENRFDLKEYRKRRNEFIARVSVERDETLHFEIQDLMKSIDFRPPPGARALAFLLKAWRVVPHDLRRRIRGFGRESS